jgi:hypothetical protein
VQRYIYAFNNNDVNKFKEAFEKDASMFYIDVDGSLYKNPISKSFEGRATPPGWGSRAESYRSPRPVTPLRSNLALTRKSPAGGIDFHNLLRTNGVWKSHRQVCHAQQPVVSL